MASDRRVLHGGSWIYILANLRPANRNRYVPDFSYNDVGLRLVRVIGAPGVKEEDEGKNVVRLKGSRCPRCGHEY